MIFVNERTLQRIRRQYPAGTRIELVKMDDFQAPPLGTKGTVTAVDDQGKKKMAYEIQDMRESYYYFIQVDADAAAMPATVEAQLRIMDNVIRYLIVRADA